MGNSERVAIPVTYEGQSPNAYMVCGVGKTKSVWVPKSECSLDPEGLQMGSEGTLWIPQWLLDKKEALT